MKFLREKRRRDDGVRHDGGPPGPGASPGGIPSVYASRANARRAFGLGRAESLANFRIAIAAAVD